MLPVIGEDLHPVAAYQELQRRSVKIVQQVGGFDAGGVYAQSFEPTPQQRPVVELHVFTLHLQSAAQGSRLHHGERPRRTASHQRDSSCYDAWMG